MYMTRVRTSKTVATDHYRRLYGRVGFMRCPWNRGEHRRVEVCRNASLRNSSANPQGCCQVSRLIDRGESAYRAVDRAVISSALPMCGKMCRQCLICDLFHLNRLRAFVIRVVASERFNGGTGVGMNLMPSGRLTKVSESI